MWEYLGISILQAIKGRKDWNLNNKSIKKSIKAWLERTSPTVHPGTRLSNEDNCVHPGALSCMDYHCPFGVWSPFDVDGFLHSSGLHSWKTTWTVGGIGGPEGLSPWESLSLWPWGLWRGWGRGLSSWLGLWSQQLRRLRGWNDWKLLCTSQFFYLQSRAEWRVCCSMDFLVTDLGRLGQTEGESPDSQRRDSLLSDGKANSGLKWNERDLINVSFLCGSK